MKNIFKAAIIIFISFATYSIQAYECRDAVVLVHGNTTSPSSWDNTYEKLLDMGYDESEIFLPDWGSKWCASCNNHYGTEEDPVIEALEDAVEASCTGKIDVVGHSMGVTLAAKEIVELDIADKVDTFVGIAGAWKGLWSCGVYPYNVWSSTCGADGLSISSPLLDSLADANVGSKVYSVKSYIDEIVCSTGICLVNGEHSSRIPNEIATFTYPFGHFGLQTLTAQKQIELITTAPTENMDDADTEEESIEDEELMTEEEYELYGVYW